LRTHTPGAGESQKRRALHRELNERLQRLAEQNGSNGTLRLLCECGHCSETMNVAADVLTVAGSTPAANATAATGRSRLTLRAYREAES
jgi:hypothetical protein